MKPRRILVSSFACSPLWGSEPGVGWHWLIELAKRHHVVLITHSHFREHLEPLLETPPWPRLRCATSLPEHLVQIRMYS